MAAIRNELVNSALNRSDALVDDNIHNNLDKVHEFKRQTILADESLTKDEKSEAIKWLNNDYDYHKLLYNDGTKRICENCQCECLVTLFCENCVRNYLKANFSNWTSGNDDIDNLIQRCQMETLRPDMIVEWIPYNNLSVKGGSSEIYTADWIDGDYFEWDSNEKQLKRFGTIKVVLKRLGDNKNRSWFDEAKSNLTLSNKWNNIARCYGLTQDPSNGQYMLVMHQMDTDLENYLRQNHNLLTWEERIHIINDITNALLSIHEENAVHRDLHSGSISFSRIKQRFFISDLKFCGPVDKPLKTVEGNLPYLAPEIIAGKEYTFASDIYSIAMLMWEVSSGQPPFANHNHDYNLAMKVINGMRPKIVSGTPSEYEKLMKQCWDADPIKRPPVPAIQEQLQEMRKLYNQNKNKESSILNKTTSDSSKMFQFENLPKPRNATEEEQEAFHSKPYNIPDNIDDVNDNNNDSSSKLKTDEDEVYNNPNLHSEKQDELEIPDDI